MNINECYSILLVDYSHSIDHKQMICIKFQVHKPYWCMNVQLYISYGGIILCMCWQIIGSCHCTFSLRKMIFNILTHQRFSCGNYKVKVNDTLVSTGNNTSCVNQQWFPTIWPSDDLLYHNITHPLLHVTVGIFFGDPPYELTCRQYRRLQSIFSELKINYTY